MQPTKFVTYPIKFESVGQRAYGQFINIGYQPMW